MKKLVFLGDSVTEGYGVLPDQAYPALIGRLSKGLQCMNHGRSGWSTTGYVRRLNSIITAIPNDVHLCTIQLGANDLRLYGHSTQTVDNCCKNMGVILETLMSELPKAQFVLMASPNMIALEMSSLLRSAGFGERTNDYLNLIRDSYASLAIKLEIAFIDLSTTLAAGDTLDGAHPNPTGHLKIAERIWPHLQRLW